MIVELNAWTRYDGEKQIELRYKNDGYSILLAAWWCPPNGKWLSSLTSETLDKIFQDVIQKKGFE